MSVSRMSRAVLAAAVLFASSAPPIVAQTNNGRVGGTVEDENGERLEGVQVLAEVPGRSIDTVTDSSGRFTIIGFPSGQFAIAATMDGYRPDTGTVQVTQTRPGNANFTLVRVRSGFETLVGDEALEGLDAAQLEADMETADAAFEANDYDTAIAGYNALLAVVPSMAFLHLNIGNAYLGKGENERALEVYQPLADHPEYGDRARLAIARTRFAMGDLEAAAGLAAAGASASREDMYNLGEVAFSKGEVDSAAEWYEKASAAAPSWEKPWFKLALVALNKGDVETAKKHFQKVVELAPNSEEGTQAKATLSALL